MLPPNPPSQLARRMVLRKVSGVMVYQLRDAEA